ncbi:MAG: OsmC family protein [Opitutaceae bacterium]
MSPIFDEEPNIRAMVKITGEYHGELHCTAKHGPSGRTLETDAPVDNQGRGETFSPTDLVATALGTCILTTLGIAARRLGLDLKGARFEVTKEMSADTPRRILRLATHVWLPMPRSADRDAVLERTAHACPVHKSLSPAVDVPVVIHWLE